VNHRREVELAVVVREDRLQLREREGVVVVCRNQRRLAAVVRDEVGETVAVEAIRETQHLGPGGSTSEAIAASSPRISLAAGDDDVACRRRGITPVSPSESTPYTVASRSVNRL